MKTYYITVDRNPPVAIKAETMIDAILKVVSATPAEKPRPEA